MKLMLMFLDTAVQQGRSAESTQALHAAWGARSPTAATGKVEIRPVLVM